MPLGERGGTDGSAAPLPPVCESPFRAPIGGLTVATVGLAAGLALAAVASLVARADVYAQPELRDAFLANDVVVLTFVVPAIVAAAGAARRGGWLGAQIWPGAPWLAVYITFPYVLALPQGIAWLAHLISFVAALYLAMASVAAVDGRAARRRWEEAIPARAIGATMAMLGGLFFAIAASTLASIVVGSAEPGPGAAVFAADLLVSPAWIVGGAALYRRRTFGYAVAPALLAQLAATFVALFLVVAIAPLVSDAVATAGDVAVLLGMALVAAAPLAAFLRAASRRAATGG